MTIKTLNALLLLSVAAGLAACGANPRTEANFGDSVRQMKAAQAFASGPVDTIPVEEGDGERVMNVLEVYRTSVSRPQEVQSPIVLDIGGSSAR
jgi:hypothetical protein